ncbi:MAG: LysM peptidoglycan-binding domain-containing protein [Chloroflexi bacterium]|nr:LysM peptidoglycan-binding domain-containing protein [Chloroflexota bacterium]
MSLDLRLALLLVAVLALVSAGITFAASRTIFPAAADETPTGTPTPTATQSLIPSPTPTSSRVPSVTPRPPIRYTVVEGDTCGGIAFFFDVTIRSMIEINNLGTECLLSVGTEILVPQPTATVTPEPTNTLAPAEATEAACPKDNYTVVANDSLFAIAQNYNVSMQSIKDFNGLIADTVFEGQRLVIPLCERLTIGGATPTPTRPPPYPAPNLLLPRDGEPFTLANETVSLQWAAVGALREGEFYRVTVADVTEQMIGSGSKLLVDYVSDTKYIIPTEFRSSGTVPHVFRWWIEPVRLSGTSASGEPRYSSAGARSVRRVFTWSGSAEAPTASP